MKVRIQFEKRGAIRFTSHKDVMRILERAFAAAGVPVSFSEGFHPHVRMSFGPPLKTGWEGLEEYMDLQLESPMDEVAAAVNAKLPDGFRVTRVVPIDDRTPKLAVDIVAVELEAVMETADAIAAGAPTRGHGVDAEAITRALSSRILPTPGAAGSEPGLLGASIVQTEDVLRIRYLTTMDNGRVVTPDSLVAATIGDPATFRVPLKVTRLAQFVSRDGRHVSPVDQGVVQSTS
ncbi:MAG TPA: TIGR03936 family radical SAM-associated protein [Candidatus Krumholzibacteria bacterium]|nr:TIGR03936 family radical SAM-associated protein [Candidatus Krumholzibacteria bacterium]